MKTLQPMSPTTQVCRAKPFSLTPWHCVVGRFGQWEVCDVCSEPCCVLKTLSTEPVRAAHAHLAQTQFRFLHIQKPFTGSLFSQTSTFTHTGSITCSWRRHVAEECCFIYSLTLRSRSANLSVLLSRKQIQSLLDRALKNLVRSLPEAVKSATQLRLLEQDSLDL